ncbi:MAG: DEAD/DEAH box helicase, partial [Gammaproteobacteria bacterium]|nr:DEAD/DEAH box helicase [Gammaproteobacteria bacterium]
MKMFSAATRLWFQRHFDAPTEAQSLGWPIIAAGQHVLITAPTGSGKTLAAFLWAIDRLMAAPDRGAEGSGRAATASCGNAPDAPAWPRCDPADATSQDGATG